MLAHKPRCKSTLPTERIFLTIEDDGRGFKPDMNGYGYGLRDIRDHARLLGSELAIDSELGTVPGSC